MEEPPQTTPEIRPATTVRAVVGGALMGLANLVPGISGGTVLLAIGVYPQFISGVAELTAFRFRKPTIILIGAIGISAALTILLLAGTLAGLVDSHRWIMYSLFIGLTLGGVPVVWSMLGRLDAPAAIAAAVALAGMALLSFTEPEVGGEVGDRNYLLLCVAGIAAASAMILPGISGGYILIVLGQYLRILGAVDDLRAGLGGDGERLAEAMHVCVPVGIGVLIGVATISNLARWCLLRHPRPTLGFLLGLLVGSVLGLWPFRIRVSPDDAPVEVLERFAPTPLQVLAGLVLVAAGFGISWGVSRLGRSRETS